MWVRPQSINRFVHISFDLKNGVDGWAEAKSIWNIFVKKKHTYCFILNSEAGTDQLIQSCFFFFYLGFLSQTFTNHRTAGKGGGHLFSSSLPLPPASQTLRHQPGDYYTELTSTHSQQPDLNQEPLVCKCKSLTTKLHALIYN